ncbi:MAG: hypothetical protein WAO57_12085 [Syntrophomonadaceae bacterium]|jgi:hypothetical protein|nr:hypothetical protein [Bacillota bacterium]NLJ02606.1 hypothetical protein [Bacillota bacterium]
MDYFLVFTLGIAVTAVVFFILRPGLFTRSSEDYAMLEAMVEQSMEELETRQAEILQEIEGKHKALLELQEQIMASFIPAAGQSPKVLAVLELAKEEENVSEIAKKLGLGLGEVQLILELNKGSQPLAERE